MATQTAAFPDDRQHAADVGVVRRSFNTHGSSEGPQRRNKLGTNHNCLHDPERIISICPAVPIVLDFIRTAELKDLARPFRDGAEHLENIGSPRIKARLLPQIGALQPPDISTIGELPCKTILAPYVTEWPTNGWEDLTHAIVYPTKTKTTGASRNNR